MMLEIWFGKEGAMSLNDNQTSFGNWLDDQIVIFKSLRAERGPKYFPNRSRMFLL